MLSLPSLVKAIVHSDSFGGRQEGEREDGGSGL